LRAARLEDTPFHFAVARGISCQGSSTVRELRFQFDLFMHS
jgi:hypothetical protein